MARPTLGSGSDSRLAFRFISLFCDKHTKQADFHDCYIHVNHQWSLSTSQSKIGMTCQLVFSDHDQIKDLYLDWTLFGIGNCLFQWWIMLRCEFRWGMLLFLPTIFKRLNRLIWSNCACQSAVHLSHLVLSRLSSISVKVHWNTSDVVLQIFLLDNPTFKYALKEVSNIIFKRTV